MCKWRFDVRADRWKFGNEKTKKKKKTRYTWPTRYGNVLYRTLIEVTIKNKLNRVRNSFFVNFTVFTFRNFEDFQKKKKNRPIGKNYRKVGVGLKIRALLRARYRVWVGIKITEKKTHTRRVQTYHVIRHTQNSKQILLGLTINIPNRVHAWRASRHSIDTKTRSSTYPRAGSDVTGTHVVGSRQTVCDTIFHSGNVRRSQTSPLLFTHIYYASSMLWTFDVHAQA